MSYAHIPPRDSVPTSLDIANVGKFEIKKESNQTLATLKRSDGGKEYFLTVTFDKSATTDEIKNFIQAHLSQDKVQKLVETYKIFETNPAFAKKKNLLLEKRGDETRVKYSGSKHVQEFDFSSREKAQASMQNKMNKYREKAQEGQDKYQTKLENINTLMESIFARQAAPSGPKPTLTVSHQPAVSSPQPPSSPPHRPKAMTVEELEDRYLEALGKSAGKRRDYLAEYYADSLIPAQLQTELIKAYYQMALSKDRKTLFENYDLLYQAAQDKLGGKQANKMMLAVNMALFENRPHIEAYRSQKSLSSLLQLDPRSWIETELTKRLGTLNPPIPPGDPLFQRIGEKYLAASSGADLANKLEEIHPYYWYAIANMYLDEVQEFGERKKAVT